jgi:hypothetical protein
MVPLGPYFKNRELSDSLGPGRKRVNELVPFRGGERDESGASLQPSM